MTVSNSRRCYPLEGRRIWVAGHTGMVGSAVVRRLAGVPCTLLTVSHRALDLRRQHEVERWVERERPEVVVVAAAKVGGIQANASDPATFLYDNLMIAANVLRAADLAKVERLVFLGSSCVYPRLAAQPMVEGCLLGGPLEPTNAAYAVAKIAGIVYAEALSRQKQRSFFAVMPTNLYGPGDSYDLNGSHVIPALMRKLHEARLRNASNVEIWGSGLPLREFLHVDDLADALVFLLENYRSTERINVGSGTEISIAGLAEMLSEVIGYVGAFTFDSGKPDGAPRKLLDTSRLAALGWCPSIDLRTGLRRTYEEWRLENFPAIAVSTARGERGRELACNPQDVARPNLGQLAGRNFS